MANLASGSSAIRAQSFHTDRELIAVRVLVAGSARELLKVENRGRMVPGRTLSCRRVLNRG